MDTVSNTAVAATITEPTSFLTLYDIALQELQQYEIAMGVYKQRLDEKATAIVDSFSTMITSLEKVEDEKARQDLLACLPQSIDQARIDDPIYLKELKVAFDKVRNYAENYGMRALGLRA